ncbi:carbohydrate ABC transporter permease [Paenibacillus psychroresistens]|uniref:Carbohydrate ABC transporter permease n=1 Tax=Paenibacillus psychroresistens TaxID=1778678 RepID=A0A6B8RGJ2_9BACL|nr:carbohydrate ABC transporter permease [Paenibacillus psychroresistens]QGQ95219.1 carbohydrate ABC transporter permease [Paenibacillus psychroresistens]
MIKRNVIGEPFGDRVFMFIIYAILIILLVLILYPLLHIVAASLSNSQAVIRGDVTIFPVDFTLIAYKSLLTNSTIYMGFLNTIFYTVVGTIIQVILTILLAFPLSRKEFVGRTILMMALLLTMFFEGGLIPTYMIVKFLHLLDTRWALIVPKALFVWQVIITVTFFKSIISDEVYESAQLDGCSDIGFIWRIVMPLSKPIIAVLVLMYAVSNWNSYFDALLYLQTSELYPLQLVLRNILVMNQVGTLSPKLAYMMRQQQGLADLLKYALIVVSTLPIIIFYPFVQKHFVKGMMIGSLKG